MLDDVLEAGPERVGADYAQGARAARSGGAPSSPRRSSPCSSPRPPSDGISGRLIAALWDDWADASRAPRGDHGRRRLYAAPDRPVSRLHAHLPRRGRRAGPRAAGRHDRRDGRRPRRGPRAAAGGCSSSASAAAPGTPRTRSTTSARSATSRATRRPTTSPSSPRASTTTAGRAPYAAWLKGSRIARADAVLVFSVGGGSREHGVSTNLVAALDLAREVGASIYGIVGKADGETARVADACVVVPGPARAPHAAGRGLPGRRLAPDRLAPPAGRAGREVGVHRRMTPAAFVDRDGVINEPVWDARTRVLRVAVPPAGRDARARRRRRARAPARRRASSSCWRPTSPRRPRGRSRSTSSSAVHERVVELLRSGGRGARRRVLLPPPPGLHGRVRLPQAGARAAARRGRASSGSTSTASWMIGDADTDVTAAHAAGARAVLVEHPRTAHRRRGAATPRAHRRRSGARCRVLIAR